MTTDRAALLIKDVSKRFHDRTVLDRLTIEVGRGEVYALLGSNGAGKTTTINLALGFIAADAGRIEIAGVNVGSDPIAARAKIAYLPETVMLHPSLSAIENLQYFALLGGRRLDPATAERLLAEAGFPADANRQRASAFSKGMRQKVGVAIALGRDVSLLLLDEPTSGLDAAAANDLSATIRAAAARGIAVLLATHDLFRVRDIADRLGILRNGRLVEERAAASLGPAELEALYLERLAA